MKFDLTDLFNEELNELEDAKKICLGEADINIELIQAFKRLTSMYSKILKQVMSLTKISDSQQNYLKKIQLQLEKEIKEREIAEKKLEYYAFTDQMTEIPNRRTGLMMLKKEVQLSVSNQKPISVCSVDIDGLKKVNDIYGHAEGDSLIKSASRIIRASIRAVDEVSRMGGDEFLIIFPDCKMEDAQHIVERIQENMKQYDQSSGKPYRLIFSFGIEEVCNKEEVDLDELLKKVDVKMYKNKLMHKELRKQK